MNFSEISDTETQETLVVDPPVKEKKEPQMRLQKVGKKRGPYKKTAVVNEEKIGFDKMSKSQFRKMLFSMMEDSDEEVLEPASKNVAKEEPQKTLNNNPFAKVLGL